MAGAGAGSGMGLPRAPEVMRLDEAGFLPQLAQFFERADPFRETWKCRSPRNSPLRVWKKRSIQPLPSSFAHESG